MDRIPNFKITIEVEEEYDDIIQYGENKGSSKKSIRWIEMYHQKVCTAFIDISDIAMFVNQKTREGYEAFKKQQQAINYQITPQQTQGNTDEAISENNIESTQSSAIRAAEVRKD